MPWDLLDKWRDEDYWQGQQLDIHDCIKVAEIGSEAWLAEQVSSGRIPEERDA